MESDAAVNLRQRLSVTSVELFMLLHDHHNKERVMFFLFL